MSPPVLVVARPLAPQPMRPADGSAMQPLHTNHPLKSTRSRRGTINAACRECRLKKLKCDGTRPSCQRCIAKGIDSCEYPVNPGETRFTALKRKNASLLTESDRMQKFIHALRDASPSRAQDMLRDFRSADDDDHGRAKHEMSTLTPSTFDGPPHLLHHQNSDSSISSGPSPPSNSDIPQTPNTSRSRSSNTNTNTKSLPSFPSEHDNSLVQTPYQPFSDFERPLPSTHALRKCVEAFYHESGKLFQVYSRSHIEAHFQLLEAQGDKQALRLAVCELCAVAALGSQYMKEILPEGTEQTMYNAAKHLLEDVVTVDTTRAAKVCAILGMFNIMNKEKVAMTFVEMGLNLLSRPPIAQVCPPNMDRGQWIDQRKVWRVLVFLETWLSSTLGYVSGLKLLKDSMNPKNLEEEGDGNLEEKVTTEMIKITVIKFDMLRLSLQFKDLSALTVETITHELRYWHQNLPAEMHLTELENNPEISFELRRTIYYVNFLYFGAHIMLLRRVLQSMHEQSNLLVGDGTVVNNLIVHANFAARESAKLFTRLLVEGGIVQRCWICIFQAYSSCVLILHHVAEMLYEQHMGGQSVGNLEDELRLALACLDFLGVCSQRDVAAGKFHSTLTRFYATLHATATGQLDFGLEVINTARDLNELIRRPFKSSDQVSPDCCYLWQGGTQQNIDSLPIGDVANASDETLCCDSWQRIDGIRNDGMIQDLLSSTRPGHFITGFESSAWTDSTVR